MVGNFCSIDPRFWHFPIPLGLFLCPTRSYWLPLSAEKISLSLSHLFPEIIWAKIGLIFHKNLSFDHFETFCTNVLLHFRSYWPPFFFTVLRSFWPLIFTKPQIPLGPFFHCEMDPPYQKFGEVPPPLPQGDWYWYPKNSKQYTALQTTNGNMESGILDIWGRALQYNFFNMSAPTQGGGGVRGVTLGIWNSSEHYAIIIFYNFTNCLS